MCKTNSVQLFICFVKDSETLMQYKVTFFQVFNACIKHPTTLNVWTKSAIFFLLIKVRVQELTKWILCSDGVRLCGFTQPNIILSEDSEDILVVLHQVGHRELKGGGVTNLVPGATVGFPPLHDVESNGLAPIILGSLPGDGRCLSSDVCHLHVPHWWWLVCKYDHIQWCTWTERARKRNGDRYMCWNPGEMFQHWQQFTCAETVGKGSSCGNLRMSKIVGKWFCDNFIFYVCWNSGKCSSNDKFQIWSWRKVQILTAFTCAVIINGGSFKPWQMSHSHVFKWWGHAQVMITLTSSNS